jgi:hypothetical protein
LDKNFKSSFVPLDIAASVNEHSEGVQGGESCGIDALKDVFAWMRGTINGWYGYSNDGKTQFRDFIKVLKSKRDGWKWCLFRPEDMDTVMVNKKPQIKANRIYHDLAWVLTGKTYSKEFAKRYFIPQMTLDEMHTALEFIEEHFFVIYPKDRRYQNLIDEKRFIYEKYGVDGFETDPISGLILPEKERGDERLAAFLFDEKQFALETNTVNDFVNHPKSMDVKEKDGRFKVVTQFMVLGGSMNDAKMDGQYSIYRPERHLNPSDPKVHFWNLKQKNAQIVGAQRGVYEKIQFSFTKRQYYFDGINPISGEDRNAKKAEQSSADFTTAKPKDDPSGCPF